MDANITLIAERDALQIRVSELEAERDDYKLRFSSYYALEDRVDLLSEALGKIELMATVRSFQPADYETVKRIARAALAAEPVTEAV